MLARFCSYLLASLVSLVGIAQALSAEPEVAYQLDDIGCPAPDRLEESGFASFDFGAPVDVAVRELDWQTDKVDLSGNLQLRQGNLTLKAENAEIIRGAGFSLTDGVSLTSSSAAIEADTVAVDLQQSILEIESLTFAFKARNFNGQAGKMRWQKDEPLRLKSVLLSTCHPDQQSWAITADALKLDHDSGWAKARGATLRIGDVPVFYLPYLSFPIDNRPRNGFLVPTFAASERTGFDISTPIYWRILPNLDTTWVPRYMGAHGFQLGLQTRYLTEYGEGRIEGEYLPNDQDTAFSDRYFYQWRHELRDFAGFDLDVHLARVSDDQYFQDLKHIFSIASLTDRYYFFSDRTVLPRFAALTLAREHLNFSLFFSDYQVLNSGIDPFRRLPSLRIGWQDQPLWSNETGLTAYAGVQTQFDQFDNNRDESTSRIHLAPYFQLDYRRPGGFISPKLELLWTHYRQKNTGDIFAERESRFVPIASLDMGLFFERGLHVFSRDYIHTIEPRIFYWYAPDINQDEIRLHDSILLDQNFSGLFRTRRFAGLDRVGDANQMTVAVTQRLSKANTGEERLRLSIGQLMQFESFGVGLEPSDALNNQTIQASEQITLAELDLKLSRAWSVLGRVEYDHDLSLLQQGVVRAQYQPTQREYFQLSHRYRRPTLNFDERIEQTDVAVIWEAHRKWKLLGRFRYDWQLKHHTAAMFGIEFEACCFAIRLMAERLLDAELDNNGVPVDDDFDERFDDGIYLEFIFKGLGQGIGNASTSKRISKHVWGYQDPFRENLDDLDAISDY